nr:unnamed protein product [Spirometra erinaceieuropaei]
MKATSDSNTWMNTSIIRGTWFRTDTWQPLPEKLSEDIELIYCTDTLKKQQNPESANKKTQIMQSIHAEGGFVRFMSDGNVFFDENSTLHYLRSKLIPKYGTKLSRGYKELADIEDKSSEISHLVFVEAKFPSNFKSGDCWKPFPEVANLFCLGSPLAVFLVLRGARPLAPTLTSQCFTAEGIDHETSDSGSSITSRLSNLPETASPLAGTANVHCNCQSRNIFLPATLSQFADEHHLHHSNANFRLFNIFHPRDLVAYRIEPLILQHYADIHPVVVGRPNILRRAQGSSVSQNQLSKSGNWHHKFQVKAANRVKSSLDPRQSIDLSSTSSITSEPPFKDANDTAEALAAAPNTVMAVRKRTSTSFANETK